jgi:hypothetical protein
MATKKYRYTKKQKNFRRRTGKKPKLTKGQKSWASKQRKKGHKVVH